MSNPKTIASTSAIHDASMMLGETPIVVHTRSPSVESMSTRVTALVVAFGLVAGLGHTTVMLLGLSASVPTAMNGNLLAKQMGGDAPLYAAISTLQTVAAFITMPLVLAVIALV